MNFFKYKEKTIITSLDLDLDLSQANYSGDLLYLFRDQNKDALGIEMVQHPDYFKENKHTLEMLLERPLINNDLDRAIAEKRVLALNLDKVSIDFKAPQKKKFKVHVLGLGDVGGIMLSALRMLGGDVISEIGIFDLDENKVQRWLYELNQIMTIDRKEFPKVVRVDFDQIMACDIFIFTASTAIPEVGSEVKDVRMYQLENNAKIISIYANKAKEEKFEGQFLVVSDPVDHLCKVVLRQSELRPEQIKGFGLGVMNARAAYYGQESYKNGRAFGPHGKLLVIADDIDHYNQEKSLKLTKQTIEANLEVRAVGYKPFIAPALSSAALSIIAYLEEKPHYSTIFVDGAYFGCKHTSHRTLINDVEQYRLDDQLLDRLNKTHKELKAFEI